jgi:DNA-binding transcriptional LysR family regulator
MDFSSLQIFCDLVDTQSFTVAAGRNFVSQSAVSQRMRALEQRLGQTLIDRGRGTGRATPTEAGRILYEGARSLIAEAAELEARVRGLSGEVSGTIRVATVYSVGLHTMPERLKVFLAAWPQVKVHLEYSLTGKIYEDVQSGAVDVGIVACPDSRAGIDAVPFADEQMVVVCSPEHPLAGRASVHLSDLQDERFIAFSDDFPTRRLIDSHLRLAGARPQVVSAYDNIETIKNLVEIGSGIAVLPEDTVKQEVRGRRLVAVPIAADDAFRRPAGMLLRKNRTPRPAVAAFVRAMSIPQGRTGAESSTIGVKK